MSDLRDLYQETILDHNREPRNFRKLEGASCHADGYNPLCGDKISVYVKIDQGKVLDVGFIGSGCAISKASGSIMTSSVKGKSLDEVELLFENFHQMVTGKTVGGSELGKLRVFSGVSEFPSRVKCATLAWHTLKSALEGRE